MQIIFPGDGGSRVPVDFTGQASNQVLPRCFYINLPPGAIVAGMLIFSRIPEGGVAKPKAMEVVKDLHNKLDLVGFALFAPSVMMLLLAVQWGGNE